MRADVNLFQSKTPWAGGGSGRVVAITWFLIPLTSAWNIDALKRLFSSLSVKPATATMLSMSAHKAAYYSLVRLFARLSIAHCVSLV